MRPSISVLAFCAGAAAQQTTNRALGPDSSRVTATVLAGTLTEGLAGSIIDANPCDTTYAFACTEGGDDCDGRDWTYYLTKGLSTYQIEYTSSSQGTKGTAYEFCSMHGSFSAVCTETIRLSYNGTRSETATTITASGTDLTYGEFPITAGAHKLAKATGICTTSGNAAVATGSVELLKVIVVPAAAVAMAAGMMA
ncbi:hypothetical protein LTR56_010916 [Elasticomyces elasticus]|nr:hypothetical protein LTR56_010916 [Elasticomyces elasticus]KAK3662615.1 hypothetical protein LTR22_006465 [Elasticomyces elasticus]